MITIAFNEEEQGQADEEFENINTASDKMLSDNQKEKVGKTKDKAKNIAKKVLKNKEVLSFIAANIVPILIVIAIIILIIILVGQFAFFTTMPGMMVEKIKEFAVSVWANFQGFFTGDNATAAVTEQDVLDLAQYIENMGGECLLLSGDITDKNGL